LLIGLDCAAPELLFHRFIDKLPNFRRLLRNGVHGRLESCDPPITIPAWAVMASGKDPGALGVYGFRHREDYSYSDIRITTSKDIREKRVWDYVSTAGGKSCIVGVPPSYPPFPLDGCMIGGFIAPSTEYDYTYPQSLKNEIDDIVDDYALDVEFRIDDKINLEKNITEMTGKHFKLVKHLITAKEWRFFMFVEIGLDRIHHAFWRYFDETHHLHEPGSGFENVVEDYYILLDRHVGEILQLIDNETIVIVSSDHGGKAMKGAFCINAWLERQGYLRYKEPVDDVSSFNAELVDWAETTAWGWGGYYARVFLNVKGRETHGTVDPEDYETMRDEIAERLRSIRGPDGEFWDNKVMKPEDIYSECNGKPPDLMIYFDDLNWRSAGTTGHRSLYLAVNDTGPDDAMHDKMGVYVYFDPKRDLEGKEIDMSILDIAPTILRSMGLPIPEDLKGTPNPYI
jgi:predicted AlkP superfamily phosphohydrolase/phosphomutase